jgi:hypothetical protein
LANAAATKHEAEAKCNALTAHAVADTWVADTRAHCTPKHAEQVEQSFRDDMHPEIGSKPIDSIDPGAVLDLLGKMLAVGKIEAARRVRQRLDAVFEYAGLEHRIVANPVAIASAEYWPPVRRILRVGIFYRIAWPRCYRARCIGLSY